MKSDTRLIFYIGSLFGMALAAGLMFAHIFDLERLCERRNNVFDCEIGAFLFTPVVPSE